MRREPIKKYVPQEAIDPTLSTNINVADDDAPFNLTYAEPRLSGNIVASADDEGAASVNSGNFLLKQFSGGCVTARDKGLLPFGAYSMIQNAISLNPGFEKRKGQIKLHSTADGTNQVVSMYQFKKARVTESHFYAQFSDGDVLEATNMPPAVTAGVFGSEVYSGTASGQYPASWGNIGDLMIYSNGVDQHQVYAGTGSYVDGFIVWRDSAALTSIPDTGSDYSFEVSDGQSATVAILDSLDTYANHNGAFIRTPVPAKSLTWTIPLPNGTASVASLYYWNGAWTELSSGWADTTASSGKTLASTGGTMSWTAPTDILPKYMFGVNGYWYQLRVSAQLDSEVEVSAVTYAADWQAIEDIWDGVLGDVAEIQFYDASATVYYTFGSSAAEIDSATSSDKFYFSSADQICGFYVDVGSTPNTTAATTINAVYYWDGDGFTAVSGLFDGTAGLSHSGWVTFTRPAAEEHPTQFNNCGYSAYWYYFTVDKTLNDDVIIGLQTMPYFDMDDFGKGQSNCIWKNRACYSFTLWPEYIYISKEGAPFCLSSSDAGVLEAGDGRSNRIVAMRKFYNEIIIWQEEKGLEGGCVTLIEGYTPATFGKLLLSSKVGTFSNNSVDVVDGVIVSTATDESIKTMAFFLSRYGVCVTDGRTIWVISDDIQNYFDPQKSECIRRGYEKLHWLKYDSTRNAILIGLVSGSSATVPNIFPVFHLADKTWTFDARAQEISCIEEIEAGSGDIGVIQVGGGVDDGTLYLLNYGTNDITTVIDTYATLEFGMGGEVFNIEEFMLRCKVQSSGNITVTITQNDIAYTTLTLSMTAETASHVIRRHRSKMNVTDQHVSVKIQNNGDSNSMILYDYGIKAKILGER